MVKLGDFNRKKITFKQWKELKGIPQKEEIYTIKLIFPPNQYPTYSLFFDDNDNNFEVKLSLKTLTFKSVATALGFTIGKRNLPSLLIKINKNEYGIDVNTNVSFFLEWKGSYWKLNQNANDDTIEF